MLEERLWPRDGAGARVKLFDGTSVAAIVMEVGAENIDLSVRTNAHRLRDTEGTAADLQWNTDASHVYAVGTILKVDQGQPVRCQVRFNEPAKSVQRRSYVRIPMLGSLPRVKVTAGQLLEEGLLVDLSEAGLRVRVPEAMGVGTGDLVHIDLELDGTLHELSCKVVRVLPTGPRVVGADTIEQVELGVRFEENDDIRRWVLTEQLRRRHRG